MLISALVHHQEGDPGRGSSDLAERKGRDPPRPVPDGAVGMAGRPRPDAGRSAACLTLRGSACPARPVRSRDLQREIEEGLNVVEAWNGASAVICYGRGGEISANRREEVELTARCLRIRQAALVAEAAAVPGRAWRLRVRDNPPGR